jgi:hypothetical protein
MRYILLFGSSVDDGIPTQEQVATMMSGAGDWFQKYGSKTVSGEKLSDPSTATTVRLKAGSKPVLTDGPFIEGKEIIGGFTVVDVENLDEALTMAKEWPASTIVEVRPVDPNAPRLR